MTDLRKAAEMALEALEWNYGTDLCDIENCMAWLDKMNATIPALRQALAMERFSEVNQEIEEALKQPEQEPVAWVNVNNIQDLYPYIPDNISVKPLYTAPSKREWVGLTDDEFKHFSFHAPWEIVQEIEAKLKEKNT